jgi:hypothetical protein
MSSQTIFKQLNATSQSTFLTLYQNAASPAPGDPILGLAYNTAGLQCYYAAAGGSIAGIGLVTLAAPNSAYSSGGFVQMSSTEMPGLYRFDIPSNLLQGIGEWDITFSGTPAGTAGNMETHHVKLFVGDVAGVMITQMVESYAASGVVPTPAQGIQMAVQTLLGFLGSGTALTIYKRDNATQAMVGTFNAAPPNATGLTQTT